MADGGNQSSDNGGGWWGSLIAAAKQQSEKVCDMVSNDLAEFTSTMQNDTKKVVEKTKETLQNNTEMGENKNATDMMKQSFHSLMSGITKALTVEPEDTAPKSKLHVARPTTGIFDRAQARLRAIQIDTGTYLQEPSGSPELFADWLKSFDLESHKGDISELLVTMVEVRSLYTSLVPSEVSHQEFWQRYFYKVHQLQVDEARKQALMKRAERANTKDDSIGWDEEEEWSGDDSDGSPGKNASSPDYVKREDPSGRLEAVDETYTASDNTTDPQKHDTDKEVEKSFIKDNEESSEPLKHSVGPKVKVKHNDDTVNNDEENSDKSGIDNGAKGETEDVVVEKPTENNVMDDVAKSVENDSQNTTPEKKSTEAKTEVKKEETLNFDEDDDKIKPEIGSNDSCDRKESTEDKLLEKELTTKVKGDMVVVGDRVSPSTDSSGTKESEDWEQDFDVDITAEDLAAASQLAQKMNMSAAEYNQLTGGEDEDWENWD